ncbi:class I glutamine amidotransferase-like protein [Aspergillus californicus]
MAPKILIVLSSFDKIAANNHPTGWFLLQPEFAHPWEVLHDKAELVIASPKGGAAPLDPSSVKMFENDPVSAKFLKEQEALWKNTKKLSDVKESDFDAIFYVGGHGPMFDLTEDKTSIALIQSFAVAKKPVSAVCHGPCVFLNVTTPSGKPIVTGAQVTGFSNVEEDQVQLSHLMPFMLEDELVKKSGGNYVKADQPWGEKVVVSKVAELGGTLITGQNPASATGVGQALLKALGI